ncbi:MFS transporter [bacterium]|nr:MFS transporter [bacterium]
MGALTGHPRGLYMLFFAEMWERFSYYGMRALLVFYMTKGFLAYGDARAAGVYGAYTGLVYATPVVGGLLADRILGFRIAVILGGVLMALGHLLMMIETQVAFYTALALLIVGNGFFKPNISSMVGKLYGEGDQRRDAGFTIFYMGINTGAFLAPIICGYVGETFGWHYGFGLATAGMLMGLIVFVLGQDLLGEHGLPPSRELLKKESPKILAGSFGCVALISTVLVTMESLKSFFAKIYVPDIVFAFLVVVGIITMTKLFKTAMESEKIARQRLFVVFALMFFQMVFWMCFEQAGSSLSLFTDRNVNRTIFGFEIKASVFQAVNPLFIIMFAPLLAAVWDTLASQNRDPSAPVKFFFGLALLSLGFVCFWFGAKMSNDQGMVWMGWLILGYLFQTTGELCLSPVGLSLVTKMSPQKIVGVVMGAWFLAIALANYLSGKIAELTSVSEGGEGAAKVIPPPSETVMVYGDVFGKIAIGAFAASVLVLALSPILTRWMHMDKLGKTEDHFTDAHEEIA